MSFLELVLLLDKTEDEFNSILPIVSFWPILQQSLPLHGPFSDRCTSTNISWKWNPLLATSQMVRFQILTLISSWKLLPPESGWFSLTKTYLKMTSLSYFIDFHLSNVYLLLKNLVNAKLSVVGKLLANGKLFANSKPLGNGKLLIHGKLFLLINI